MSLVEQGRGGWGRGEEGWSLELQTRKLTSDAHISHHTLTKRIPKGDAAAMWKDLRGCAGDPEKASFADTTATSCTSLCAKPGSLELCKMAGIGHQLDIPYQGYPFTVAWQWFAQH